MKTGYTTMVGGVALTDMQIAAVASLRSGPPSAPVPPPAESPPPCGACAERKAAKLATGAKISETWRRKREAGWATVDVSALLLSLACAAALTGAVYAFVSRVAP